MYSQCDIIKNNKNTAPFWGVQGDMIMEYREKINVYVSKELKAAVRNDAVLFEIFKRDQRTVNTNGFLSMLLLGYFDSYSTEKRNAFNSVADILRKQKVSISDADINEMSYRIINEVWLPFDAVVKCSKSVSLSIKPTKDTELIFQTIEKDLAGRDTISQYIRRMLNSYFLKAMWERERIIFHDSCDIIQEVCKRRYPLTFFIKWNNKAQHEVIPYKLVAGTDGMYNYLVCAEINESTGSQEVRSYRLNRITKLGYGHGRMTMDSKIAEYCKRTVEESPQYAINDDEEICVKMSDAGEKLYNRIYFGRPRYIRINDSEDGHYYYFRCSPMQVFHYFRRFDNSTAVIISPLSLREKMKDFHLSVYNSYL